MRLPRRPRSIHDVTLTDRGRALVAAGVTLALAGAILGFVDLVRIGVLLVVLPACAVLVSRWSRPSLRVRRAVTPSPVPAGTSTEVVVTVTHSGRHRSGACLVEDTVTPAGDDGYDTVRYQRFQLPALAPGSAARLRYHLAPIRRGCHELGPLRVHMGDAFGLTRYSASVAEIFEFVSLTPLTELQTEVTAPEGEESTDLATLVVAGPGDPSPTVREYRSGDDTRRIHWSASARRGDLLVRVEEQANARRAVLVLDQRFPALAGYASAGLDWAVEALASVAVALGGSGHVLHLVCDGRLDDVRVLDPVTPEEAVRVLSCVAPVRPRDEDPGRVRRLREAATELAAEGGLLVAAVPDIPSMAATTFTGRPARATGMALVVGTTMDSGEVTAAPRRSAGLAADAVAGGWHAVAVEPDTTDVLEAWTKLVASVTRGSW